MPSENLTPLEQIVSQSAYPGNASKPYLLNLWRNRINFDFGGLLITKLNSSSTLDALDEPSFLLYLKRWSVSFT